MLLKVDHEWPFYISKLECRKPNDLLKISTRASCNAMEVTRKLIVTVNEQKGFIVFPRVHAA